MVLEAFATVQHIPEGKQRDQHRKRDDDRNSGGMKQDQRRATLEMMAVRTFSGGFRNLRAAHRAVLKRHGIDMPETKVDAEYKWPSL